MATAPRRKPSMAQARSGSVHGKSLQILEGMVMN
jgi:hypothetical protein